MLALLLGAVPAPAQESPGILPNAAPSAETARAARAHVGKHVARRKPTPHIAAPATVVAKTAPLDAEAVKSEVPTAESAEISAGERLKIQSALLWSGDYTGSIPGEDPFLSAIKNYQKRAKSRITGVLSLSERANLLAAAKSYEDEFGWRIVTDPLTGVRLGLPSKLVPQVRDAARGTRWSAAHGEVQVETFRIKESEIKLAAFFEQQKKEPANRKVESSVLRDDSFIGLMEMRNFVLASIEPAAPPVRLITAETIRNFLAAHNVAPAQQAGDAKASVVRIICVRK